MKKYKNHNGHLSEEAIAKYLQQKLSPEEMYAIEKHLLSCGFCHNAVEGFEAFGELDVVQVSAELQAKLKQRTAKKTSYYRLGIAASISLLLAFSVFFLFDIMNENDGEIALSPEKKRSIAEPNTNSLEDSMAASKNKKLNRVYEPIAEASEGEQNEEELVEEMIKEKANTALLIDEKAAVKSKSKANLNESHIALADEELVEEVVFEVESEEESDLAMSPANTSSENNPASRKTFPLKSKKQTPTLSYTSEYSKARAAKLPEQEQKELVNNRALSGTVYDESGEVIPGVNVVIKGRAIGTTTDIEGNYNLAEAEANDELIFSFIGMEVVEVNVGDKEVMDVSLSADMTELSEVVVVSEGVEGTESALDYSISEIKDKSEKAFPVGGFSQYKAYLKSSLKYPKDATDNKIEGIVKLELGFDKKGNIINISVLESLGFGCDEEAKRLVNEGANWKPAKMDGKKITSKQELVIEFNLSKK